MMRKIAGNARLAQLMSAILRPHLGKHTHRKRDIGSPRRIRSTGSGAIVSQRLFACMKEGLWQGL